MVFAILAAFSSSDARATTTVYLPITHPVRQGHIHELGARFVAHLRTHFPQIGNENIHFPLQTIPSFMRVVMPHVKPHPLALHFNVNPNSDNYRNNATYELTVAVFERDSPTPVEKIAEVYRDLAFHQPFEQLVISLAQDVCGGYGIWEQESGQENAIRQYRIYSTWGGDLSPDLFLFPVSDNTHL